MREREKENERKKERKKERKQCPVLEGREEKLLRQRHTGFWTNIRSRVLGWGTVPVSPIVCLLMVPL